MQQPSVLEADYVIVGAGAAGCVLADRLSASGSSVIIIEAGPKDTHPYIHIPKGIGRLAANPALNWAFATEADGDFLGEVWPRGKTLGGSTSTNGLIYNRGRPEDYNSLETMGCTGWNWSTFEQHFKKIENYEGNHGDSHGTNGPLHISMPRGNNKIYQTLISAGTEMGMATPDDMNAPERFTDGAIGLMPRTIYRGKRWSAARAFLNRARARSNLKIVDDTFVDRILIEKGRAIGVVCETLTIKARYEIILSAGAISSPAILQRSGIGPTSELRDAGVNVIVESPEVGKNLVEHRNFYLQFRLRDPAFSQNRDHRSWRLCYNIAQYLFTRSGLLSDGACEVGGFVKAMPQSGRPDTQLLVMPISMGPVAPGSSRIEVERQPGITIIVYPLRPQSRGSIMIRSGNPHDQPYIKPQYLSEDYDKAVSIAAVRFVRRYVNKTRLSIVTDREIGPFASAESDEEIIAAGLRYGGPGCHAAGTCRMGSDATSVVDAQLKLRNVEALRVVDNSVFPVIVAGNTGAPVMALANRAADLILQDKP